MDMDDVVMREEQWRQEELLEGMHKGFHLNKEFQIST